MLVQISKALQKERFANREPVPGSLARTCPEARSHVDFVRVAHFAQDDIVGHTEPLGLLQNVYPKRRPGFIDSLSQGRAQSADCPDSGTISFLGDQCCATHLELFVSVDLLQGRGEIRSCGPDL
ncbi:MAG: hypothetical protein ACLQAT_00345 [Candidatus Binataceae bacterium]